MSSTFSDLKEERNALQREVFPKLRELCMEHGFRFQAIDLRWGVSEEAGLDQQTMKICLEEIERSQRVSPKPNFIVLLGDRYGWRPLPYEIPADEFEEIYEILEKEKINEENLKLLKTWFRRDDNAVPPVYDLQPRKGKYEDYDTWTEIENKLNSIIRKAILKMNLKEEDKRKYFASATEQEILHGALEVEDAEDHVFCFFREIEKRPLDRKSSDFIDIDNNGNIDIEAAAQLSLLKKELTNKIPKNIFKYETVLEHGVINKKHIEKLCEDVYNSLVRIINEEIDNVYKADKIAKEIDDHLVFGKERLINFVGRNQIQQDIESYLDSVVTEPLVIKGLSGSGKTALMAFAAQKTKEKHPKSKVIVRYIGATASSSNVTSLINSLCCQISRLYNVEESDIPTEYPKLIDELLFRLSLATNEHPLIIFLDALDQLSDLENARNLSWLPKYLPENVHLIVSTIYGECLDVLKVRLPEDRILELKGLQRDDSDELLELLLKDISRKLLPYQKEELLTKFSQNGLPLYLKLAFHEAVKWKSYTTPNDTIISDEIPDLIRDMYGRLSSESNHGKIMVSNSLGYLAASRYGLSEDEIIDVLSRNKNVLYDFKRRSPRSPDIDNLPFVVWSRLFFDLEPYLTERQVGDVSLLTFYHNQMAEVAKEEYLSENENSFHLALADYFESRDLDDRKVDELPWQLNQTESLDRLKDCITEQTMFMKLMDTSKEYELMGYWHHIGNRYNMVNEYEKTLQNYEENTTKRNLDYYMNIAIFLKMNAYYEDAEPIYKRILELNEQSLGPEHPQSLNSLNSLAVLLGKKGDYDGAETLFRRVLKINEKILGPEHPNTVTSIINLSSMLNHRGDCNGAEILLRRALEINEKVLGPEHPNTATNLNTLGQTVQIKGDLSSAEHFLKRSLEMREKVLGPEHPDTAHSINNLAEVLNDKGDLDSAETLLRRALEINKKVLGPEHPDTIINLSNLALVLNDKGDLDSAETLLRRALEINKKVLGPEHPDTAKNLINLAQILQKKEDYNGAETFYRQALKIMERIFGPEDVNVAINLNNLALILYYKGDLDNAETIYRSVLEISESKLGLTHPLTSTARTNLNALLKMKGIIPGDNNVKSKKSRFKFWKK